MQIYSTADPCWCWNQHKGGGKETLWFDNAQGSNTNLYKEYITYVGDLGVKEMFKINFKEKNPLKLHSWPTLRFGFMYGNK